MEASHSHVYQFKIVLRSVSPMIWRRVLIPERESLAELHRVIQIAFDYMDIHLQRFLIHGREYGISKLGGPSFQACADQACADQVQLASLELREGERFLYTYDFFCWWKLDVRLEKILPLEERAYPVCIGGKGRGPIEDCGGPEVYQRMVTLSKRGPLKEYLHLCLNLGELFDPTTFDRRAVNRKLKSGAWPEEIIRIARPDDPLEKQLRRLLSMLEYGTAEPPWDDDEDF